MLVKNRSKRYNIDKNEYYLSKKLGLQLVKENVCYYVPFYIQTLKDSFPYMPRESQLYYILRNARRMKGEKVLPRYYFRKIFREFFMSFMTKTKINNIARINRIRKKTSKFFEKENKPWFLKYIEEVRKKIPFETVFFFPFNSKLIKTLLGLNKTEQMIFWTEVMLRILLFSLRNRREYRYYSTVFMVPGYRKRNLFLKPRIETINNKYRQVFRGKWDAGKVLEAISIWGKLMLNFVDGGEVKFGSDVFVIKEIRWNVSNEWEEGFKDYLTRMGGSFYIFG
ncbi:MAG: hypothetical protein NZM44_01355, partial [Candidatus Calescibacterium sp.]|nr:hypothetical protein [Candidatus Calescibacterium sp.]